MHFRSHTFKMGSMIVLVLLYFFVELIVGHILKSVTLVADSFHMLSDFIALSIGILARRVGKWPKSSRNTFGWQRAEVVGTLTNTVMLTTLTFTILIKAIQRFIEVETIEQPKLLFYVGIGGLVVNIIGLIILGGNHGHSHGPTEIEIEPQESSEEQMQLLERSTLVAVPPIPESTASESGAQCEDRAGSTAAVSVTIPTSPVSQEAEETDHTSHHNTGSGHNHSHSHNAGKSNLNAAHMNIRAVFLHVLADFMGSVAVVTSAMVLWLVPGEAAWKQYIDPSISLVIVILILSSTIPLLKKSALILLQSVPKDVSIHDLKQQMEMIEGIERVHDLHVWLLQSDVIIGTVHIKCSKENYVEASKKVKELFHNKKIHCTTIQAEFDEHGYNHTAGDSILSNQQMASLANSVFSSNDCMLSCRPANAFIQPGQTGSNAVSVDGPNNACHAMTSCCPTVPSPPGPPPPPPPASGNVKS